MAGDLAGGYHSVAGYSLAQAALVAVDLTNDFAHPDGVYGRHGFSCEPIERIVSDLARLFTAAKQAAVPVIGVSQFVFEGLDGKAVAAAGLLEARPWLREEGLRRGTWGTRVIDALPAPDIVIDKPRASGFLATPLDLLLRGLGVDTVIVVGGYTNQCIASTVRDAWALDYRVVLPPDGCAAFDPTLHEATLRSLSPLSVQVPIDELVERLSEASR